MDRLKLIYFVIAISLSLINTAFAAPHFGGTLSILETPKEPPHLRGFQFMLDYDPQRFQWRAFDIYFDAGVGQFWDHSQPFYTTLTIYSIAPVIRYSFIKRGPVYPYLDLSIGLAYFNHTHIADRNLGMHPALQDRMGIGGIIGESQQVSIGVHIAHYSNAHLCSNNAGISVPVFLDVGYRFG